uniref:Secreted protein n=1 Tax=Rodentolepis nana TaxID=102285 RepID=A0A0R3TG47_RODNA
LEFLRRWSYFQAVWRSALSGTPLPEPLNRKISTGVPQRRRHQSPNIRHFPVDSSLSKSGNRNIRKYQPICLRLLTRRAVRGYIARAEMSRRHCSSSVLTPVLTIPSLQRFLGYFHSLQHMLGAPLPTALQILLLSAASPSGDRSAILQGREEENY